MSSSRPQTSSASSYPPPAFTARLANGHAFEVPADQPLLLAAVEAGLDWPSSCRNGTCRTCIRRLLGGVVHYLIEWPGLLPEEKAEGWILPCVAYPRSDLVLDSPAAAGP